MESPAPHVPPTATDRTDHNTFSLPSESYSEAVEHLDYRLSELVFGSLVVAYVLGFVAFLATTFKEATVAPIARDDVESLIQISITYVSISLAFAFLTAGLYRAYHFTALPRPTVPFIRVHYDFAIALLQALGYGIAMCIPILFFPVIVVIFAIILGRQWFEFRDLAKFLFDRTTSKDYPKTASESRMANAVLKKSGKAFSKNLARYLSSESEEPLRLWRPTSRLFILSMVALGAAFCAILFRDAIIEWLKLESWHLNDWVAPFLYLLFLCFVFAGYRNTMQYGTLVSNVGPFGLDDKFKIMCDKFGITISQSNGQ